MGNNCDIGKGGEYLGRVRAWPVINMLGGWASPEGISPDVTMRRETFETAMWLQ